MTAQALYRQGVALLKAARVSNAQNETIWLLERGSGITRLALHQYPDQLISPELAEKTHALFCRRAQGEPLQYILGSQEFFGLEIEVSPAALIPRPETELLIREALALVSVGSCLRLLDLGTGSGCLAVALAVHLRQAKIVATDCHSAALALSKRNAARYGVDHRIQFLLGNLFEPFESRRRSTAFMGIVSNPPYVRSDELSTLPVDVRDHEPRVALDGGPDGLTYFRTILSHAWKYLDDRGFLILEMGSGQAEAIRQEAEQVGRYRILKICQDAAGIDRVICLERHALAGC